jgi:hypothetical protein
MAARLLWPHPRRLGGWVQRLSIQSVVVVGEDRRTCCNTKSTAGHLAVLKSSAMALILNTTAGAIVVIAVSVSAGLAGFLMNGSGSA